MENENQLDMNYVNIMRNIDSLSAKSLVSVLKLEIDKQNRLLILSNSTNDDFILKGGIRTLERIIKTLERNIIKSEVNQ